MMFSKTFTFIQNDDGKFFVQLNDFYSYLKSNDVSVPRIDNFRRTFKDRIETSPGNLLVPVQSILKYIFRFAESSKGCEQIALNIESELLKKTTSKKSELSDLTSLNLYKKIAKTKFLLSENLLSTARFDESSINTLIVDHRQHFTDLEWQKICLFELHFSKTLEAKFHELDYDTTVQLKYQKYESLLSVKDCGDKWASAFSEHLKQKSLRLDATHPIYQIEILASKRHKPLILDKDITTIFKEQYDQFVCSAITFDTITSRSNNTIQACIEVKDEASLDIIPVNDLCRQAFWYFFRKHCVLLEKVIFISSDSLAAFKSGDILSRFLLRDSIENQLVKCVAFQWDGTHFVNEHRKNYKDDETSTCDTCFESIIFKPLTPQSFDIVQEWYLDVPLETQILFEKFINNRTLQRSKENASQFLKQKLQKLYLVFDILLNVSNKKFVGIFQQSNTDALLVEYKNVQSVFQVTSSAGITFCQDTAEKKLKSKSEHDLCYYNTYLKQHELEYQSAAGPLKRCISLRQCHLILMLDNLVRLKYIADPNPGESRSKQICTLPITLQGLPQDSVVTEAWHVSGCDKAPNCLCKQIVILKKEDTERALLKLTDTEERQKSQFQDIMTWGYVKLWREMTDEVSSHVGGKDGANDFDRELDSFTETDASEQTHDSSENCEEDIDLHNVLSMVNDCKHETSELEHEGEIIEHETVELDELSDLEKSMEMMSILEENDLSYMDTVQLLGSFGFSKFMVPPLLCRHPPPAIGRDDDVSKIKEILDEVLVKSGFLVDENKKGDRILCGPDNKIGKCLLKLMESDKKYLSFLPEFPLLHLRKSKITILFSAYKEAGLVHIVRFMRDDGETDWTKLISIQHIDTATRYVKRISLALHLAFLVSFSNYLDREDAEAFLNDMESLEPAAIAKTWSDHYERFVEYGRKQNATFSLHYDMMVHCDHIIAIALAERLGGPGGYALLLSAVKGSLLFTFLNNASSYAPYCVQLLFHHYSAGYFHKNMKEALFSTPFKKSRKNFACDTKRELDHLDAIKGFRSGSTVNSVTCRLSLIDSLNEASHQTTSDGNNDTDTLGWELTDVDMNHIQPTCALVLRRNGLSVEECDIPYNVYAKSPVSLPLSILDEHSHESGKFLLYRYLARAQLFQFSDKDISSLKIEKGPTELISRAMKSKGITIKRVVKSKIVSAKTERQLKEEQRLKEVSKKTNLLNCFSSENNSCQALLKPDSSKPKVIKSVSMQRALRNLLALSIPKDDLDIALDEIVVLGAAGIPPQVSRSVKVSIVEFAGVKFKLGAVKTGREYLLHTESSIKGIQKCFPNSYKIIVCEEKYSFTPDEFKAGTRDQRKSSSDSVDHLKSAASILSETSFQKDALTKTSEGKKRLSIYLAQNAHKLDISNLSELIIDSEYILNCSCKEDPCNCQRYCTPLKCVFGDKEPVISKMDNIWQRKGEAEMAQVDWLIFLQAELKQGDAVACYVTSGDIDAIYIHMFVLSKFWPRNSDGTFQNTVYIILQKPRFKVDIYNVTKMLEVFETYFSDRTIGLKIALALCMGGNDFMPKCYQISHDSLMKLFLNIQFRQNMFTVLDGKVILNKSHFLEFYKMLYCPKRYQASTLTFDEVRAITIGKSADDSKLSGYRTNDPRKWLPPESALLQLSELLQLQIEYLETAGKHDLDMPKFLESSCLRKDSSGEIHYYFGPEAQFTTVQDLPDQVVKQNLKKKRLPESTPQGGARRKRPLTSTPKSKY